MFIIGEALVEDDVVTAQFACDLQQCKGACCTLPGGRGAPLEDDEVEAVKNAYPHAMKYLAPDRIAAIERDGLVEGMPGSFATSCVGNTDCVLVYYEGGIAKCSLERAYFDGSTSFRKPVSCHLFPVRVHGSRIRYEQIRECGPGRSNGEKSAMPLHRFLEESLIRKFGNEWYDQFRDICNRQGSNDD
jgi:hypothetical protein